MGFVRGKGREENYENVLRHQRRRQLNQLNDFSSFLTEDVPH